MADHKKVSVTNMTGKPRSFRDATGRQVNLKPGESKDALLTSIQEKKYAEFGRKRNEMGQLDEEGEVMPVLGVGSEGAPQKAPRPKRAVGKKEDE
jgi:hypothetical protein